MHVTFGNNIVCLIPDIDQEFADSIPMFQMFLADPSSRTGANSLLNKTINSKQKKLKGAAGMHNALNDANQILE